jgi:thiol:disulfide interchange protein DsbC
MSFLSRLKSPLLSTVLGLGLAAGAFAANTLAADTATAPVEAALHSRFPKLTLQNLKAVPEAPGLYEFAVNGQRAYTTANASYVLVGELLVKDGDKVVNLTKASAEKTRASLFEALPKERAIKVVFGKGERQLAVFEDPNCPFCQAFEHDMAKQGDALNATVYVFLFPIESLHQGATAHSEYLWCSKDPADAWKSWMSFADDRRGQPADAVWNQWQAATGRPASLECGDRGQKLVAGNIDLGHSYGFHQTPILLFSNGTMWPGALPMDKLETAFRYAAESTPSTK